MVFNYEEAVSDLSREYSDEEIVTKFKEMGLSAIKKNDCRIFLILGREPSVFNEDDEFHRMVKIALSRIPQDDPNSTNPGLSDTNQGVESSLTAHPVRISPGDKEALKGVDEAIEKHNRDHDS